MNIMSLAVLLDLVGERTSGPRFRSVTTLPSLDSNKFWVASCRESINLRTGTSDPVRREEDHAFIHWHAIFLHLRADSADAAPCWTAPPAFHCFFCLIRRT